MIICQPSDRRSSSGCDKTPVKASTHGAVPSPRHDHTATGPSSPCFMVRTEGKWIDGGARMVRGGVSISYGLEVGPIQSWPSMGEGRER
ncbi:hypothetical protein BHM03_00014866 [Ensete ventricosum]|nr:hypothetical protein BHM03_00014866 [Ensete ventricosum]